MSKNKKIIAKPCELCFKTWDGTNKNIANHILCEFCLKKLKIWKKETIIKRIKKEPNIEEFKDCLLNSREPHYKRIIFYDIMLEKLKNIKKED
ncbi:hypothetical protein HOE07_04220 [archaeon]|jgi:hypothetical protein|nr:hypothetical protein [archaeon]